MHVDRRNNRIFDTRIFSPLLERPSKHRALRGFCFCVSTRISDGLERQGQLVTVSKKDPVPTQCYGFMVCVKTTSIGVSMDKTVTGVGVTSIFFKNT